MNRHNMVQKSGFPVHNSVLSGQALTERVLVRYGLPEPVECHFLHLGVNDTCIVKAGGSTYYRRVMR